MSEARSARRPAKAGREQKSEPKKGGRKKASRGTRWFWFVLVAGFFSASAAVLALIGVFSYYGRDLPNVTRLRYDPPQVSRIFDRKGKLIAELFEERRTVVPMSKVPRVLVLSVLAAEDADFYRHRGLDYAGIVRALVRDAMTGKAMQGASTITQQIVKNIFLTPERTIARKVKELILARRLEQELSKDQILHLYLNHIYFGHGRYGVQEASRFFFGKDVSKLNLAEASLLAGLPQAPERLSPLRHPQAARARQHYVLNQLDSKRVQYWNDLPAEDIERARNSEVTIVGQSTFQTEAPEAARVAQQMLEGLVGAESARRGGYTVRTTIDLDLETAARSALLQGLETIDSREHFTGPLNAGKRHREHGAAHGLVAGRFYDAVVVGHDDRRHEIELDIGGVRAQASLDDAARQNPKKLAASTFAPVGTNVRVSLLALGDGPDKARARLELGPEGAVVVIDPRTREVLALVGGDRADYGFDRALQAIRQPGSTWKPITYALAFESGRYTPATLVLDAPGVFDKWKPDNFETWSFQGAVRLREAVAQSINLPAVRVMDDLTPVRVIEFARRLGITTDLDPSLALALGASDVRPIELVNAYATFAAGGRFAPYRIVQSITDAHGKKLALPEAEPPREVLKPATAYVLTSVLRSVITDGTAKAASKLGRPAAGKTGTSNNSADTWFVGYTPELVAGVWVGFDDHRSLGKGETGAKCALPIWIEFMKQALGDRPAVEFPVPSGVERVLIDPKTGLRAYDGMPDAFEEVFVAGTAPTQTALPPDVVNSEGFMLEQLGGGTPPSPAPPTPGP